jgi:hypothetical protein
MLRHNEPTILGATTNVPMWGLATRMMRPQLDAAICGMMMTTTRRRDMRHTDDECHCPYLLKGMNATKIDAG